MSEGQTPGAPGAPNPLRAILAATAEARAFARVAVLWRLDWEPFVPVEVALDGHVVVLVHGLLASAGVMRPLRARLEQLPGVHAATFSYGAAAGVAKIAGSLREVVERLPENVRLHLVGHSLGGVAVRWYVQQSFRDPRIVQTISIAAPFQGARGARFMPGQGGRDLRSDSPVLRRVLETAPLGSDLPHLSIYGSADSAVPVETRFPVGEHLMVPDCGHNGLLFHPGVAEAVAARIAARPFVEG